MFTLSPTAKTDTETQTPKQPGPNNTRRALFLKVGGLIVLALIILGVVLSSYSTETTLPIGSNPIVKEPSTEPGIFLELVTNPASGLVSLFTKHTTLAVGGIVFLLAVIITIITLSVLFAPKQAQIDGPIADHEKETQTELTGFSWLINEIETSALAKVITTVVCIAVVALICFLAFGVRQLVHKSGTGTIGQETNIENMDLEHFRVKLASPTRADISNIYQKIESIVLKKDPLETLTENFNPTGELIEISFFFTASDKYNVKGGLVPIPNESLAQHYARFIRSYHTNSLTKLVLGHGPFVLFGERLEIADGKSSFMPLPVNAKLLAHNFFLYAYSIKTESIPEDSIKEYYQHLFNMLHFFLSP